MTSKLLSIIPFLGLLLTAAGCSRPICLTVTDEVINPYYLGNGVEKDLEKAAEIYRQALEAGYEPDEGDQIRLEEVLGEEYIQ